MSSQLTKAPGNGVAQGPEDIMPVLGAAHRSLVLAMMARVAQRGFHDTTPAFATLIPLLDATGARPTSLAQRTGTTKQAISQLVRELETRGYVEQVVDPADTRAKIVRLTRKGVALRTVCASMRLAINEVALRSLGSARLARLRQDLRQLAAAYVPAKGVAAVVPITAARTARAARGRAKRGRPKNTRDLS